VAFKISKVTIKQSVHNALGYFYENNKEGRQDSGADVYNDIGRCWYASDFSEL